MGRIARNLGLLMSGKTVAGLISLVYIALSARVLGVTDYGVLNLVHGFATFMGALIAFSGFHPIVTYGTQALHEQDMARLSRLLAFMTLLECALALIAISTTAAFAQVRRQSVLHRDSTMISNGVQPAGCTPPAAQSSEASPKTRNR